MVTMTVCKRSVVEQWCYIVRSCDNHNALSWRCVFVQKDDIDYGSTNRSSAFIIEIYSVIWIWHVLILSMDIFVNIYFKVSYWMTAHTLFCVASCEFMTLLPFRRLGGGLRLRWYSAESLSHVPPKWFCSLHCKWLRYILIIATSHKKGMCSHWTTNWGRWNWFYNRSIYNWRCRVNTNNTFYWES